MKPKKRAPTRSNPIAGVKHRDTATDAFERQPAPAKAAKRPLPDDIADAAEAALDDLIGRASPVPPPLLPPEDDDLDEPRTTSRAASEVAIESAKILDEDNDDELELSTGTGRRKSSPAIGRAHVVARAGSQPPHVVPRTGSQPAPPNRASPVPVGRTPPTNVAPPNRASPIPVGRTPQTNVAPPNRASPMPAGRASPPPSGRISTPIARGDEPVGRPSPGKIARGDEPVGRASPIPTGRASPVPITRGDEPPRRASQVQPPGMTEQVPTIAFTEPARLGAEPRFEDTTGSAGAYTPTGIDTTNPLPDDALVPVDDRSVVELPPLRFAIYEDVMNLASAQGAIVAAGHVVAVGAWGRDGIARVLTAIRSTTHAIDALLVSLPGGESIIDAAIALEPRRPVIIAALSGRSVDGVQKSIAAGADLVATRPHDVERLAPIVLAAGRIEAERRALIVARGTEQLLRAKLDELSDPDSRGLQPMERFQQLLELEIKRAKRFEYPLSVALFAVEIAPPAPPPGILGILRARAGNALINSIRDIDIAAQLDHERFLVLLPYTDLKGAVNVARRVIAAVAMGDPVTAAGRSFPPRFVGAVAGAKLGEAVSFAKLMKDATRALDNARRDGAELAVQP